MKKEIVLASFNQGKLSELQNKLEPLGFHLRGLSEFCDKGACETANTFVENALLKARFAARLTGLPALADDSGLCVDALNGAPGVYSARYAGEHADDQENIEKLLQEMERIPCDKRHAKFVSVIAFLRYDGDPLPVVTTGVWQGMIASGAQNDRGFGYDPVFYLPELEKMASQLNVEEKNKISHRGLALNRFLLALAKDFA